MKKQIRAKMKPNMLELVDEFFEGTENSETDPAFLSLCERIAGKEVDLIFIGEDAFEKIDNNYWLPEICWEEI